MVTKFAFQLNRVAIDTRCLFLLNITDLISCVFYRWIYLLVWGSNSITMVRSLRGFHEIQWRRWRQIKSMLKLTASSKCFDIILVFIFLMLKIRELKYIHPGIICLMLLFSNEKAKKDLLSKPQKIEEVFTIWWAKQ